jgi:hypothetical protein
MNQMIEIPNMTQANWLQLLQDIRTNYNLDMQINRLWYSAAARQRFVTVLEELEQEAQDNLYHAYLTPYRAIVRLRKICPSSLPKVKRRLSETEYCEAECPIGFSDSYKSMRLLPFGILFTLTFPLHNLMDPPTSSSLFIAAFLYLALFCIKGLFIYPGRGRLALARDSTLTQGMWLFNINYVMALFTNWWSFLPGNSLGTLSFLGFDFGVTGVLILSVNFVGFVLTYAYILFKHQSYNNERDQYINGLEPLGAEPLEEVIPEDAPELAPAPQNAHDEGAEETEQAHYERQLSSKLVQEIPSDMLITNKPEEGEVLDPMSASDLLARDKKNDFIYLVRHSEVGGSLGSYIAMSLATLKRAPITEEGRRETYMSSYHTNINRPGDIIRVTRESLAAHFKITLEEERGEKKADRAETERGREGVKDYGAVAEGSPTSSSSSSAASLPFFRTGVRGGGPQPASRSEGSATLTQPLLSHGYSSDQD